MSTSATSSASSSSSSGSGSEYTRMLKKIRKKNPDNADHPMNLYKDKKWMKQMWKYPKENEIEYVNADKLNGADWRAQYESKQKVCMIKNLAKDWKANDKWTEESIEKNYAELQFAVGGKKFSLKNYFRYCRENTDDSPVYLFESELHQPGLKKMLTDYKVPEYFKYDYFNIVGEKRRPPFRWLVVGPQRSGTMIHQDPLWTSAWNTLLVGHKKWVIWPPDTDPATFLPEKYTTDLSNNMKAEASHWFHDVYPHLKHKDRIEIIQNPGETIFVPGGWWHVVLNLDLTIAITQNFVSKANFENVYRVSKQERGRFAHRWKKLLNYKEPDLARQADAMSVSTGEVSSTQSGWTDIDRLSTLSSSDYGKKRLPIKDPAKDAYESVSSEAPSSARAMARRRRHHGSSSRHRHHDRHHHHGGGYPGGGYHGGYSGGYGYGGSHHRSYHRKKSTSTSTSSSSSSS